LSDDWLKETLKEVCGESVPKERLYAVDYKRIAPEELEREFKGIDFTLDPYHHQRVSMAFGVDGRDHIAYWHGIGSGKTLTSIWMMGLWGCRKILVVCPNPVKRTWRKQAAKAGVEIEELVGTGEEKRGQLEKSSVNLIVTNYESLKNMFGTKVETKHSIIRRRTSPDSKVSRKYAIDPSLFDDIGIDGLILDEAHHLRNYNAIQTKIAAKLSQRVKWVIELTATPVNRATLDLWSEMNILDGGASLGYNFFAFRSKYFDEDYMGWNWYPKDGAKREIMGRLRDSVLTYERKEMLGLPPAIYQTRWVEPSKEQWRLFRSVSEELKAELGDKAWKFSPESKAMRLFQIAGGFIGPKGEEVILKSNPKIDDLAELIRALNEQVIIFHRFVMEGRMLEEMCDRIGAEFASLRGEIPTREREIGMERFEKGDAQIMIAQPQSGGEGIDGLQVASLEIYYSNVPSAILRDQSEGRILRGGQRADTCVFIDLLMEGSFDSRMLAINKEGKDLREELFSYLEGRK